MKHVFGFLILGACTALGYGQTNPRPYQPAVPPPTTNVYGGGGWSGNSGASTAQGDALQGMSQVISAVGQNRLATSAAAINMTEAQSNEMRNQVQGVNTFWQMRDIGKAERAKDRGPNLTPEQLARIAREGAPRGLTPSQMDPVSGRLNWPDGLMDPSFADQRNHLDEICSQWAKLGVLDYSQRSEVRETVDAMFVGLKAQVTLIPPQLYVASRSFLQSLVYAATRTTI